MQLLTNDFLYGGDYNPDQWLDDPEILAEDIRLMKKAKVNIVSLGIFAWTKLEPADGVYTFDWMEEIINRLYENGIYTNLATPSGARPHWLADQYPEVLRVTPMRQREVFGTRHNHCLTSPVYRRKVREINTKLAERFDHHPGVILWHISNEYNGECHCPLCQEAFRDWLKEKYHTIEEVNKKWNTAFWSHDYQSFAQIESPSPIGETSIHGLELDWKRFMSYMTTDFCKKEVEALRAAGATKPTTTNMYYPNPSVNYYELADAVDIVSWDSYPFWHKEKESVTAIESGMQHDVMRSMKQAPFLLMESCPGPTNWVPVSKLKRPGMLETASLQAIAHGSDSVMYFQIRKGRGGFEKFHGALIDHYGKEDDRVYQECAQVGADLEALKELCGSKVESDVAVIYDWENRWALEGAAGPRNENMYYRAAVEKTYSAFRKLSVNVDVIDMTKSISGYKVVAAPMIYMLRPGFAEQIRSFVEQGGTFVMTYWSGVVDQYDLCFLGGTPGGLMDVMGLRSTEIDALYEGESNTVKSLEKDAVYTCEHLCQLVATNTAKPLFVYGEDFYAGTPACTVNDFGKGKAYYICADTEQAFYDDLYKEILKEADIAPVYPEAVPEGVFVTSRKSETAEYIFIQNFHPQAVEFSPCLPNARVIFGEESETMPGFSTVVLKREF